MDLILIVSSFPLRLPHRYGTTLWEAIDAFAPRRWGLMLTAEALDALQIIAVTYARP